MFRTRIFSLLTALVCLAGVTAPAAGAEVECDAQYFFSPADFSGDGNLSGICVTSVPEETAGILLLGSRMVQPGDILTAGQLSQMTFDPTQSETDREALMTYLPIYPDRVEAQNVMSIAVIGKTDQAPVAEDSALETYKNLSNEAMLKVKDPEGQPLTYTLVRQPKRGEVILREDGSFQYTPKKNKVGVDSFTYTASDPAGNVSREATVTVTVLKTDSSAPYTDTAGENCRFAAEWMKNTGIFVSESLGGNSCFQPNREVTRGEFLTMLVSALDLETDEEALSTGYSDQAPDWLKPYLAAAMRSGLTAGWPEGDTFQADAPITGAEAAVMLQNTLDLTADSAAEADDSVPAWATDAVHVLSQKGIRLDAEPLTRGEAALALYQAAQLQK